MGRIFVYVTEKQHNELVGTDEVAEPFGEE